MSEGHTFKNVQPINEKENKIETDFVKSYCLFPAEKLLEKSNSEGWASIPNIQEVVIRRNIEQNKALPSTQIYNDLILEPIQSHLTPGLTSKPPLPKKREITSKLKLFDTDEVKRDSGNKGKNLRDTEGNVSEELEESYINLDRIQSEVFGSDKQSFVINIQKSGIFSYEDGSKTFACMADTDLNCENWSSQNRICRCETHTDTVFYKPENRYEDGNIHIVNTQESIDKTAPLNSVSLTNIKNNNQLGTFSCRKAANVEVTHTKINNNNDTLNKLIGDEYPTTNGNDFPYIKNTEDFHIGCSGPYHQRLEISEYTDGNNKEEAEVNTDNDIIQILKVLEADGAKMKTTKIIQNEELSLEKDRTEIKLDIEDLQKNGSVVLAESVASKSIEQKFDSTSSLDSYATNYNELVSFLDNADNNSLKTITNAKERVQYVTQLVQNAVHLDIVPNQEDLTSFTTAQLYNQIINLNLRLKHKSSFIKLLRNELSSARNQVLKLRKQSEAAVKQKLKVQREKHEAIVKRHQKFIDQLINDKNALNQQCENLICEVKILEERYNSNMKASEHKHQVELKKMKEMHMVGEKIKRERWIDNNTQKIKELTAKGLESELQQIILGHQQELSDLRALHKNEIKSLELKGTQTTQQQCVAIREEMIKERENAVIQEREILQERYKEFIENENIVYQKQICRLQQEYNDRTMENEQKLKLNIFEKNKAIKQAQDEFEEKFQNIIKKHNDEIRMLKETVANEADIWKNNYQKQQTLKLLEKERKIRDQLKKERDKEIEQVIERLEGEAYETRTQMELANEHKIRCIKEKYEKEIRDLELSENKIKTKYTESKSKLLDYKDTIMELQSHVKVLEVQLKESREVLNKVSMERNQLKEIIHKEVKQDLSSLEKEIIRLKEEKNKQLQHIYSRVKLAIAKKDETLAELARDYGTLQEKCTYLENVLEQNRECTIR